MYYFLCPACNNRNDIDSDVTGQQFACGHCGHVQVVAACYYDPPTNAVPTASAMELQQPIVQQAPVPQIEYEEPPAVTPTPRAAQTVDQAPAPKKKKKKKGTMRTSKTIAPQKKGTMRTTKTIPPQKKGNTKSTRARMPVTPKKQSSPMPLILSIVSVVAIIIIICVVIASNKPKPKPRKKTGRTAVKQHEPKKTENIFDFSK